MPIINVPVPGKFDAGKAFLDLETIKVETGGFIMSNGEPLRRRWKIEMAGIGTWVNGITLIYSADSEEEMLEGIAGAVGGREVVYAATRQFDEMILKGRFTNARRAHEPEPFFPAMSGAELLRWTNIGVGHKGYPRGADLPSKEVPAMIQRGHIRIVLIHLLRDVCQLILANGNPGPNCESWCLAVLRDTDYAEKQIFED